MKAIIVEDEPLMIRSFYRYTKNIADFEIVEKFDDSIDAYEYLMEHPIDVVFLDIEMPELNGIDLARKLKESKPELKIVLITAYDSYRKASEQIGVDQYVVKPYTEEIMMAVVDSLR